MKRAISSIFMIAVLYVCLTMPAIDEISSQYRRMLSHNLGGGKCKWTPPESMNETVIMNTTTMIASYPGSGKRLTWRLLEALTGKMTGDDWDLSENGHDVLSMKSSYPHPEGNWTWGAKMDQVILIVRNPRFAIPSYHAMRHELNFSSTWTQSYSRKAFTYTERPSVEAWNAWRDIVFETEMDRWVWYIDYWMEDGLRRNSTSGGPAQEYNCFHKYMDCHPKAVIQFERLVSPNPNVGIAEMNKIGAVLDSSANVNAIEPEARPCVYNEVLSRKEFYNAGRDGKGPPAAQKTFNHTQLNAMRAQMEDLRDKYAQYPWSDEQTAVDLVHALNGYIEEVQAEYDIAVNNYFSSTG